MPTYVYRFVDTGETLEVQQAFTDAPLTEAVHPVSGELRPVKKVFTPVGITFKGSGFYKTDNRSGSSKSSTKSSSTDATASTTSSDGASSATGTSSSSSTSNGAASPSSSSTG